MAIIRVGEDKDFITIMGAYTSAVNGDTLFIDEGTYKESLIFTDKVVNLIGITDYPHEGKVVIQPFGITKSVLNIKYSDSEPTISMYIEGIKFKSIVHTTSTNFIKLLQDAEDTSKLDVIFNKCILDASYGLSGEGVVIYKEQSLGYPVNSISFLNCNILYSSEDVLVNSYFTNIPVKSIEKCILSYPPPFDIFNVSGNVCEGGIITSYDVTDPDFAFDSIIKEPYSGGQFAIIAHNGWIGYQFPSPKIPALFRLYQDAFTGYSQGFEIKASNTGEFAGEEIMLFYNYGSTLVVQSEYIISNSNAYSYIRIYNVGHSIYTVNWRIEEIEIMEPSGVDYILTSNPTDIWYGSEFSTYITSIPPTHCFSGTVTVNDSPVERDIRLFRRDNDEYLDSVTSSGDGEYYIESHFGGYHNVICTDASSAPYYNDLLVSKALPKVLPINYIPQEHNYTETKSVVLDIVDNWGSTSYISIRSIEFYLEGVLIPIVSEFTALATTNYSTNYEVSYAFNTSLIKIGSWLLNSWISKKNVFTNQRLVCMFDDKMKISSIIINNGHSSGAATNSGARNTKIYTCPSIISDTTYGASLNGTKVFDGELPQHVESDVVDNFVINIT